MWTWTINFVRDSWLWGLICNPRFWPRVILSLTIFWVVQLREIKIAPLEEFTAHMFASAIAGVGMSSEYQSWEKGVYGVIVSDLNLRVWIAPECTYLSLALGLLPWIYSRQWLVCFRLLLVIAVTLVANMARFVSWMELKQLGWLSEDAQKLWPGYIVTSISVAFFIIYWVRYVDQPAKPKREQKVSQPIPPALVPA